VRDSLSCLSISANLASSSPEWLLVLESMVDRGSGRSADVLL
jgi:hypothetical protein